MMQDNDLISRKALGISRCNPDVFNNRAYGEGWNACIAIIEAAPAVDAVPVVHGRWIDDADPGEMLGQHWMCTNCERVFRMPRDTMRIHHYCPHCGAKMNGDDDATD